MFTLEVAAQGSQGEAQRARVEVEKGLLFDGVGGHGRYPAVVQVSEGAALVPVHAAHAEFLRVNPAAPLAGTAPYPRIRQLLIKHRLAHSLTTSG